MKQVIIIVRPNAYFKTKQALSDHRFFAMSTKEVLGRGKAHVHFTAGDGRNSSLTAPLAHNSVHPAKIATNVMIADII